MKNNLSESLRQSLEEVKRIRNGELPKRNYREMMGRVKESLKPDEILLEDAYNNGVNGISEDVYDLFAAIIIDKSKLD